MRLASLACLVALALLTGCAGTQDTPASAADPVLTAAVKEAMVVASERAAARMSAPGGYRDDPAAHIPLPDDVQQLAPVLRDADLGHLVDDLEFALNRAAENAALDAAPILQDAARNMVVPDPAALLAGRDDAITAYFRQRTSGHVVTAYRDALAVHLDAQPGYQQWQQEVIPRTQQYAFDDPIQTDCVPHVTEHALNGLFRAVAQEEAAIRHDPTARTSDLLQQTFGP